ncbi:hypothetical protein ACJMK2_036657 [Sinanodonta woodiana]|uniref:Cytochrome c oxidase assembly protein COX16 homolog, mitochondrial n=1 Tax=Sinanodonta woodiana TaxID=1069815 RepID=A0ABD3WK17_SINWO
MASVIEKFWLLTKNRNFRYFLPFMAFIGNGSLGLSEFAKARYSFTGKVNSHTTEEFITLAKKKEFAERRKPLQEQIDEMLHKDNSNWVNIRGPRPGEDSKAMQDEQRRKLQEQQH